MQNTIREGKGDEGESFAHSPLDTPIRLALVHKARTQRIRDCQPHDGDADHEAASFFFNLMMRSWSMSRSSSSMSSRR
jgi:hypothetical protein